MISAIPGNPFGFALDTCPRCLEKEKYLTRLTNGAWRCMNCCIELRKGISSEQHQLRRAAVLQTAQDYRAAEKKATRECA